MAGLFSGVLLIQTFEKVLIIPFVVRKVWAKTSPADHTILLTNLRPGFKLSV
jgi:hypothetical protein